MPFLKEAWEERYTCMSNFYGVFTLADTDTDIDTDTDTNTDKMGLQLICICVGVCAEQF